VKMFAGAKWREPLRRHSVFQGREYSRFSCTGVN